jgi:hypothetical protein
LAVAEVGAIGCRVGKPACHRVTAVVSRSQQIVSERRSARPMSITIDDTADAPDRAEWHSPLLSH